MANPSPPKIRAITLTRLAHVRAELARIYSEARGGALNIGDATKLAYLLQILAKVLEGTALEDRVAALEASLAKEKTT